MDNSSEDGEDLKPVGPFSRPRCPSTPAKSEILQTAAGLISAAAEEERESIIMLPCSVFLELVNDESFMKVPTPKTFRGPHDFSDINKQQVTLHAVIDVLKAHLDRKMGSLKTASRLRDEISIEVNNLMEEVRLGQKMLFQSYEKFDQLNHIKLELIGEGPTVCDDCWGDRQSKKS